MIKIEDRVHPFSGAVKSLAQQHPQFSLESRTTKKKTNSLETLIFSTSLTPPDEEKGRKFRPSVTAPLLSFAPQSLNYGNSTPQENENDVEEDDDAFESAWMEERNGTGVSQGLGSAWKFEVNEAKTWSTAISQALEDPAGSNGNIELSGVGLVDIPDEVTALIHLTNINNGFPSPKASSINRLSNGRTVSGPLMTGSRMSPGSPRRLFIRSSSGPLHSSVHVDFYLDNNKITSENISHALWSVKSTRVLTLRANRLNYLSEGIGRLENLTTLNISVNQITYLPSEILLLKNLDQLLLNPNPFISPPPVSTSPSKTHLISPLTIHFTIPTLQELSIRALLSLKSAFVKPTPFPAHLLLPFLTTFDALPSRSSSSSSSRNSSQQPFDPLSNICRSPFHPEEAIMFYKPAVERMEWVRHVDLIANHDGLNKKKEMEEVQTVESLEKLNKARVIPIKHRGCGIHCLDWLEM